MTAWGTGSRRGRDRGGDAGHEWRGRPRRWVAARARNRLRRYSLNNRLLIGLRHPEATYVCGFKAWLIKSLEVV
jgi:hypothetical protein